MENFQTDIGQIPKDNLNWDAIADIAGYRTTSLVDQCKYRYDMEKHKIYTSETTCSRFTYIAKASEFDLYKIGHTTDLKRRMKELSSIRPYSLLKLDAFAYTEEDIETFLKAVLPCRSHKLPEPFNKTEELLHLSNEDVAKLLSVFSFKEIRKKEDIPSAIYRTKKTYFDPNNGECNEISISYSIQS